MCEKLKPSMADKQTITAGLEALEIPNWRKWAQDCNKSLDLRHANNWEASRVIGRLYTALMMLAPNLTWLRIRHSGREPFPDWLRVVHSSLGQNPIGRVPKHLQHLNIDACGSFLLSDAIALFHLPALKKLQLTRLGKPRSSPGDRRHLLRLPVESTVEDLTLCHSPVELIDLAKIVSCCRSLRVFVYIYEDWIQLAPEDYAYLGNALASTSTLEKMYIYDDRTGGGLPNLLHNIPRMTKLKLLTLPMATFVSDDLPEDGMLLNLDLPPNIEEFTLNNILKDDHDVLLEILRQAIASAPSKMPLLKVVRLWGQESEDCSAIKAALEARFRKELEQRGIDLQASFWEVPTAEEVAQIVEVPTVEVEEERDDASDGGNEGDERFEQAFQASLRTAYAEDGY